MRETSEREVLCPSDSTRWSTRRVEMPHTRPAGDDRDERLLGARRRTASAIPCSILVEPVDTACRAATDNQGRWDGQISEHVTLQARPCCEVRSI
jgi:hypothetical protein